MEKIIVKIEDGWVVDIVGPKSIRVEVRDYCCEYADSKDILTDETGAEYVLTGCNQE